MFASAYSHAHSNAQKSQKLVAPTFLKIFFERTFYYIYRLSKG